MPQAGPSHEEPTVAERLDSWKEIAAYLKRDVRTVRRWEAREDLPVHRHIHNRQATVYAYKVEVDRWWEHRHPHLQSPTRADPKQSKLLLTAIPAFLIVLAAAAGWRYVVHRSHATAPHAVTLPARLFAQATGENAKIRWIQTANEPFAVFIHRDGHELYAPGYQGGVAIIATDTEKVVHTIPLPLAISAVLSPDSKWLYVGTQNGDLHIINTATRQVSELHIGDTSLGLALSPDGNILYVAAGFSGLKRVLLAKRQVVDIPSVVCPVNLALTPDGRRLYVAYQCQGPGGSAGHDAIDVLDTATNTSVGTITGLANVGGALSISPDGAQLWANGHDACLAPEYDHVGCPIVPGYVINVLRTSDHQLLRALGFPLSQALSSSQPFPDHSRTLAGGRTLQAFNTTSLKVTEALPLPSNGAMVFSPDGRRAYLVSFSKITPLKPIRGMVAPPLLSAPRIGVLDFKPAQCPPTPAGLASLWTGDGTANDIHSAVDTSPQNGAGFAPGLVGQAFQLDGVDDALAVPAFGNVDLRQSFTMLAWIKPAAGDGGRPMYIAEALSPNPGGVGWQLFLDESRHVVTCMTHRAGASARTAVCVRSSTPARDGVWQHLGVVSTPERLALFVDGAQAASGPGTWAGPVALQRPQMRIGSSLVGQSFFRGLLDEIGLYNRALDPDEIQRMFAARSDAQCY